MRVSSEEFLLKENVVNAEPIINNPEYIGNPGQTQLIASSRPFWN
jgi:hypothetical protein